MVPPGFDFRPQRTGGETFLPGRRETRGRMGDSEERARPPKGDWLGTPYLRFERHGSLAHCIVDRPERRNALTAAMYFGIRYAIDRVNAEESLAGLIITGTGDVFIPGGDL